MTRASNAPVRRHDARGPARRLGGALLRGLLEVCRTRSWSSRPSPGRADKSWLVGLLQSSEATREKLPARSNLAIGSLRPKGYRRETFAGKTAHPLDAARHERSTGFVERGQSDADVPGVGFGLIDDGKVVFARRPRRARARQAANWSTPTRSSSSASNTKALTTLLLVEGGRSGKFGWDTPVTEVYPDFKLGDADTTARCSMKHLVCACTGMPRQDLEWIFEYLHATPRRRALEPAGTCSRPSKFGEVFQYSNLMAAAAGFIGGHVLDAEQGSWRRVRRGHDEGVFGAARA